MRSVSQFAVGGKLRTRKWRLPWQRLIVVFSGPIKNTLLMAKNPNIGRQTPSRVCIVLPRYDANKGCRCEAQLANWEKT